MGKFGHTWARVGKFSWVWVGGSDKVTLIRLGWVIFLVGGYAHGCRSRVGF